MKQIDEIEQLHTFVQTFSDIEDDTYPLSVGLEAITGAVNWAQSKIFQLEAQRSAKTVLWCIYCNCKIEIKRIKNYHYTFCEQCGAYGAKMRFYGDVIECHNRIYQKTHKENNS